MQERPPTTKITRPTVSGVFQRERLFRLLDDGRKRTVVWVSGPAGSGKTTLVSSYLDARNLACIWYVVDQGDADIATFFSYAGRAAAKVSSHNRTPLPLLTTEYLQGIPTFTKRYFENLCERFNTPFTIVFDNYQDVSDGPNFHEMVVSGIEVIPPGINVIILSRNEPPRQFARLRANNKIGSVGWSEIRFTPEESREVVRTCGQANLTDETLAEVYRKTEGWMAGLVLFVEGTKRAGIDPATLTRLVPETVFDYFATEIFEKTDAVTREFLLKSSVLPSMTPQTAERLTGVRTSGEILSQLHRSHYFIEKRTEENPVYHYHSLFREFLLMKMKSLLSSEERAVILGNAAILLEQSGQIEQAYLFLRDARDWEGLVRLILGHAQSLIREGRGKTLQEWLAGLPKEIVNNNPWLLYWTGLSRMPFSLVESRDYLDRAFQMFKRQKEASGLYLSWSGIVDTFVYSGGSFAPLDAWIAEFEALQREYPEYPSPEIAARGIEGIFCALMYRQPHHPDLPQWARRVEDAVLGSCDIRLQSKLSSQLILYFTWWTGDLVKAKLLIDGLKSSIRNREVDPLSFIVWRAIEATYHWMKADHENCMLAVNEGLRTADENGIHIWDFMLFGAGAAISVITGKSEEALVFLEGMKSAINRSDSMNLIGYYHHFSGLAALFRGDTAAAYEHSQNAFTFASKSGAPFYMAQSFFALGLILLERKERKEGLACLAKAKAIAVSINCKTAEYCSLMTEAWYFLRKREIAAGLKALTRAMTIGRKQGFASNASWLPDRVSFLCTKALEAGIETDYVRELIKKRNLTPPDVMQLNPQSEIRNQQLENWPWPLKIYTLGKFQIVKDDVPVKFSGKGQQKLLSLFKAIIAYGGTDVSRQRLIDALWPDSDGAQAHQSFEITLHRLRRLIGDDKAVLLNEGLVTLDPRRCWVDVFAFEHIIGQAKDVFQGAPRKESVKQAIHFADKILSLYAGHFLELEIEQPWTISLRERLRTKFLDSIVRCGQCLEKAGHEEKAVEYLEKGLERDNQYEELYQELMSCYGKLGQISAARETYRRCKKVLSAGFGVDPSPRTEEVYSRIASQPET